MQPGDIVGPCGVSEDPNWKDVTRGGKWSFSEMDFNIV